MHSEDAPLRSNVIPILVAMLLNAQISDILAATLKLIYEFHCAYRPMTKLKVTVVFNCKAQLSTSTNYTLRVKDIDKDKECER